MSHALHPHAQEADDWTNASGKQIADRCMQQKGAVTVYNRSVQCMHVSVSHQVDHQDHSNMQEATSERCSRVKGSR